MIELVITVEENKDGNLEYSALGGEVPPGKQPTDLEMDIGFQIGRAAHDLSAVISKELGSIERIETTPITEIRRKPK